MSTSSPFGVGRVRTAGLPSGSALGSSTSISSVGGTGTVFFSCPPGRAETDSGCCRTAVAAVGAVVAAGGCDCARAVAATGKSQRPRANNRTFLARPMPGLLSLEAQLDLDAVDQGEVVGDGGVGAPEGEKLGHAALDHERLGGEVEQERVAVGGGRVGVEGAEGGVTADAHEEQVPL